MDDLGRHFAELMTGIAKLTLGLEALGRPPQREFIRPASPVPSPPDYLSVRARRGVAGHRQPWLDPEDFTLPENVSTMLTGSEVEHG